mmetsp:Transcript_31947/g.38106  ORF Transcript_31947/g.38106 Transcript_31947/m.38106 type:complete len:88 (-) Transcript_31947:773-1036(-)
MKDRIRFTFQRSGEEIKVVHRASHPGVLCHPVAEVPSGDHGSNPTADESLPCFVGAESYEFPVNEFTSAGDSTKPCTSIIADHEHDG